MVILVEKRSDSKRNLHYAKQVQGVMIFQEEREEEQLVHALSHLQLGIQLQKVVDQRLDNIN